MRTFEQSAKSKKTVASMIKGGKKETGKGKHLPNLLVAHSSGEGRNER